MTDILNPHSFITKALEERSKTKQYRRLIASEADGLYVSREGKKLINFSSNDYLGIANRAEPAIAAKEFIDKYGNGSSASRLITGTCSYHLELENDIAAALGTEAALLFNSGYQANTTVIPSLAGRESLILSDKLNHNSLLQGARLSRGKVQRYRHNDIDHLESLLKKAKGKQNEIVIVTESIFSMDGDMADIKAISNLAHSHGALLMIDEAHAMGVLGRKGMGLCAHTDDADLVMGTFGKSFGSFGAFIGCTLEMREYLINLCGGFIYTTALPPSVIGAASKSLELVLSMDEERDQLIKNSQYLRDGLKAAGYDTLDSYSQIIPIMVGGEAEAISLSKYLEDHGIFAVAIRPPTVADNRSRIRITLNTQHTWQHIDHLLYALSSWNG